MRQLFITSSILLLLVTAICAQSGQGSKSNPPPPPREPSVRVDSPRTSKPSTPSKPPRPKFVDGERIYTSKEVDERVKILKKPNPGVTEEARRNEIRGYVVLRAILAADEHVKHIEILTGLPHGLSEKAIEAARQIKFKPAMKEGKPVSVWVEVQYHFKVY